MLLYDGLHYDALAVSPFVGAPEDFDVTVLSKGSSELEEVRYEWKSDNVLSSADDVLSSAESREPYRHLALSVSSAGLPSSFLVCLGQAMAKAALLVKECQRQRQFTDMANFTLRCGVCQCGIKGEKEAREHAQATGHQNFQEY